jgi:hypothetical protein
MTVTTVFAGKSMEVPVNDKSYNHKEFFVSDRHYELFLQAMSLNTIGTIEDSSATDKSIIMMVDRFGVDITKKRAMHLEEDFVRF